MGQLHNLSEAIKSRSLPKLKAFSDQLDIAYRSIILTPQVSLKEITCIAAHRLAAFISVTPAQYRQELLTVAIETLKKYYQPKV